MLTLRMCLILFIVFFSRVGIMGRSQHVWNYGKKSPALITKRLTVVSDNLCNVMPTFSISRYKIAMQRVNICITFCMLQAKQQSCRLKVNITNAINTKNLSLSSKLHPLKKLIKPVPYQSASHVPCRNTLPIPHSWRSSPVRLMFPTILIQCLLLSSSRLIQFIS
jgi:hypothetical protein